MFEKLLSWFIKLWVTLLVLFNVIAISGYFMKAGSSLFEFMNYTSEGSPLSLSNFLGWLVILYPAIGAYAVREKFHGTLEYSLRGPS